MAFDFVSMIIMNICSHVKCGDSDRYEHMFISRIAEKLNYEQTFILKGVTPKDY